MTDKLDREHRFDKTFPEGQGRTHQSGNDDADINTIMQHYRTTGFITNIKLGTPVYEDFSNAEDYYASLNKVRKASDLFNSLPARVRAKVNNDPAQLINFVEDPANAEELIKLGLVEPVSDKPVAPASTVEEPPVTPAETETIADA